MQSREERLKKQREYYYKNHKYMINKSRKYYSEHKEYCIKRNVKYAKEYQKLDKYKNSRKKYIAKNKKKIQAYHAKWRNEQFKTNKIAKVAHNLRVRLNSLIKKGFKKTHKLKEYLGCSLEELKIHLEKQFTKGITWDNYGKWHIDHIIPLSSAQCEEELFKLCHYTNLQPLWASDNCKKGNSYGS